MQNCTDNQDFFCHESSYIDENVIIGTGTKIWHFSHILPNCEIGSNCNLGQNVVVGPNVKIGKNTKIQNNVSIYQGVSIEDNVFVGPSVVFTNVINPRSEINRQAEFKETILSEGVTIGANSTIVCGIKLGKYCFVGAGSVVTRSVEPFGLVVGNPARRIGWMSIAGARLEFNDNIAVCSFSGQEYEKRGSKVFLK